MLLKNGHRHVYLSRSFAREHGFIPTDTAPGHYGYTGLVQIGKWPITLGSTTTTHEVYLSEEAHFDVSPILSHHNPNFGLIYDSTGNSRPFLHGEERH